MLSYRRHNEALRQLDERFQQERDRRYAEVNIEREKALKIKETADLAALQLARQIQEYKDEKANELRSQIEREQGDRATKKELQPILDFIAAQTGRERGGLDARTIMYSVLILLVMAAAAISPHIH